MIRLPAVVFSLFALLATPAAAKPRAAVIAHPLTAWVPWLLASQPDLLCTGLGDGHTCVWPGLLRVAIDGQAGQFALDVWLDRPADVPLPGDSQAWPLHTQVDAAPALVEAIDEHPFVALGAGLHHITGQFDFAREPELLAVPDAIGLVQLELGGQVVGLPQRDDEGRLFLRQSAVNEAAEQDALTLAVDRQLRDGVPLQVTTRLHVRVAGRPREVVVGPVLLAQSRPLAVRSELPVQVAPDGTLRVHVRPGEFQLDVDAVLLADAATLLVPPALAGADAHETWVWMPDESLRSVELSGLLPIDPERTQLDADWKHAGRCYVAAPGAVLQLQVTRRGEQEAAPSRIELARSLWLDLDGSQWTARDRFTGELRSGWRLDIDAASALGQVTLTTGGSGAAQGQPMLITEHPRSHRQGVELRDGTLGLEADARVGWSAGRLPGVHVLPAVGWLTDVQRLGATLHLPPGWKLLGVEGVDRPPRTWLDSWTLLDFFFVLMVAAAAWKLLGRGWGGLALCALVLCHDEPDAPQGLWLHVLLALALARAVRAGKLATAVRVWHGLAVLSLLLALVPFARDQVREGLYPQVAQWGKAPLPSDLPARGGAVTINALAAMDKQAPAAPPASKDAPAAGEPEAAVAEEAFPVQAPDPADALAGAVASVAARRSTLHASGGGAGYAAAQNLQQLDPGAVVQTGPGVPRWQWQELELAWSGPVRQDHQIRLFLLSPAAGLGLALLRVLLVLLLAVRLLPLRGMRALAGRAGVWSLGLAVAGALTPQATDAAEFPPQPLLDETLRRLTEAQACDGPCLVVSDLRIATDGQQATITAEVSAQRDTGWALPGPWDALQVREVQVDGVVSHALRRTDGGLVAVRVPAGAHVVTATCTLARRAAITVALDPSALPRHVAVLGTDWSAEGLQAGAVKDSLQLTRIAGLPADASASAGDGTLDLPPWFQVERHLRLGVRWTTETTIHRDRPGRAEVLKVPLLGDERVTSDGVSVETAAGGQRVAVVHMGREEDTATFSAELPITATLQLRAPEIPAQPWTETWRLDCGAMWQCTLPAAAGAAVPVHTRDPQSAAFQPLWRPWPGEAVTLALVKPAGVKGPAITIDEAHYLVTPGQRLLEARLTLTIRTSQGGTRTLTLPDGAQVQAVTWGDEPRPIRPVGRKLALPLDPGQQVVTVSWQQPWTRALHEVVPAVDLGGPAVNLRVSLQLGESRWLLWTHGPAWGPAVLFWSHLLLLVLAAFLLARLRGLPLRLPQWLLLGLGLAQVPAPALALVVAWFVALAVRARAEPGPHPLLRNLGQLALAGLTVGFFGVLYFAIQENLLSDVDMQVLGGGSDGNSLHWYVDRTSGAMPQPGVLALPILAWRLVMLVWALWLVAALLRWLPWAWRAFSAGGIWFRRPARTVPPGPAPREG